MKKNIFSLFMVIAILFSMTIAYAAETYTINGASIIRKPQNGDTIKLTYTTNATVTPVWNVTGNPAGISVENGVLCVSSDAQLGNITLNVTSDGISASKTLTIKNGFYEDFQNCKVGEVPLGEYWKTDNSTYGRSQVTQESTNKFVSPGNDGAWSSVLNFGEPFVDSGKMIMEFKTTVLSRNDATATRWAPLFESSKGDWKVRLKMHAWGGTYCFLANKNASTPTTGNALDLYPNHKVWTDVKLVFNFDTNKYNIHLNGADYGEFNMGGGSDIQKITFGYPVDDIKIYSGELVKNTLEIVSPTDYLNLPPVGKTSSVILKANEKDPTGQIINSKITWSLGDDVKGTTIEPTTGRLTISSDTNYGSIAIKATSEYGNGTTFLQKIGRLNYDFTTSKGAWSGDLITENGNQFLKQGDNRFPMNNINGRITVEAKIRLNNEKGQIGMSRKDSGEWLFNYDLLSGIQNDTIVNTITGVGFNVKKDYTKGWADFKLVIDPYKKVYNSFINGVLIEDEIISANATENISEILFNQLIFKCDLDDVKIYNSANEAPFATNLKITNPMVGYPVSADYLYFDESGDLEDCSTIEWFISNNGSDGFTKIADGKSPTFGKENLGKYVRYTLMPANANETGVIFESPLSVLSDVSTCDPVIRVNGSLVDSKYYRFLELGENIVNVKLPFANFSNKNRNVAIAVAFYNNSQMVDIAYQNKQFNADTADTFDVNLNIVMPAGSREKISMKIFVVDNDTLMPYNNSIEIK